MKFCKLSWIEYKDQGFDIEDIDSIPKYSKKQLQHKRTHTYTYIYVYIYVYIYTYIYMYIHDSQIVHHNPSLNLFILHNIPFDNQGSEINKNNIFLRFDILSFTKTFFLLHMKQIKHIYVLECLFS